MSNLLRKSMGTAAMAYDLVVALMGATPMWLPGRALVRSRAFQ
jgi:hypothetical protein